MVTGLPERDIADTAAVAELQARLQTDFHHLVLEPMELERTRL